MNIIFLTMNKFTDLEMHNIYSDLMKEFIRHGHRPYIVTPREKKEGERTELINYPEYSILKVQTGNTSNVSLIEKGISTVTFGEIFYRAVKKELGHLKVDLILYSTPPITLATPVARLKKLFRCQTYLMLKDIFPQNAVDLGMFSKNSPIYHYFRHVEKKLYRVSDQIGCMSPANVRYCSQHNPDIPRERIGLCPNAIIANPLTDRSESRRKLRETYSVPEGAKVYIYGGNLGKPQGIPFMIDCLRELKDRKDCFFIICGEGSEYSAVHQFIQEQKPGNVRLISYLPKEEYDQMVQGCDVGLVFLDHRFTIPNYPSRILSYMEYGMPVLVSSDVNTDVGVEAEQHGYGYWCESSCTKEFIQAMDRINDADIQKMGAASRAHLEAHFKAEYCYNAIMGENT